MMGFYVEVKGITCGSGSAGNRTPVQKILTTKDYTLIQFF